MAIKTEQISTYIAVPTSNGGDWNLVERDVYQCTLNEWNCVYRVCGLIPLTDDLLSIIQVIKHMLYNLSQNVKAFCR